MTCSSERSKHEQENDKDRAGWAGDEQGRSAGFPALEEPGSFPSLALRSWAQRSLAEHLLVSQLLGQRLGFRVALDSQNLSEP